MRRASPCAGTASRTATGRHFGLLAAPERALAARDRVHAALEAVGDDLAADPAEGLLPRERPRGGRARARVAAAVGQARAEDRARRGSRRTTASADVDAGEPVRRPRRAASVFSRLIIEARPLERCGVRCWPRPRPASSPWMSIAATSAGVRPEASETSSATRPRTISASLSPRTMSSGGAAAPSPPGRHPHLAGAALDLVGGGSRLARGTGP